MCLFNQYPRIVRCLLKAAIHNNLIDLTTEDAHTNVTVAYRENISLFDLMRLNLNNNN